MGGILTVYLTRKRGHISQTDVTPIRTGLLQQEHKMLPGIMSALSFASWLNHVALCNHTAQCITVLFRNPQIIVVVIEHCLKTEGRKWGEGNVPALCHISLSR